VDTGLTGLPAQRLRQEDVTRTLAGEPTSALDPGATAQVCAALRAATSAPEHTLLTEPSSAWPTAPSPRGPTTIASAPISSARLQIASTVAPVRTGDSTRAADSPIACRAASMAACPMRWLQ
jgi:hypothetical protein